MSSNARANLLGLFAMESHEDGPREQAGHRMSGCTRRGRQSTRTTFKQTTTKDTLQRTIKSLNKLIVSSLLILALVALRGGSVSGQYYSSASSGQLAQQQQQQPNSLDPNCNDPSHSHNLQQRQEQLALSQQQQSQSPMAYPLSLDLISHLQQQQQQQQVNGKAAANELSSALQQQVGPTSGRSRSPRSIGDMFRKLFNTNKRSKQSSGSGSSSGAIAGGQQQATLNSRDWEQQQQQQHHSHQQQQLHQQNQQALAAAQLAAAAASQHAVYANPYASASSPAALYAQNPFAAYSPAVAAGLYAWPTANFQGLRAASPPALLAASAPQTATNPMGPMFAAASQPYTSYAAAPQSTNSNGNPQAAASHTHPSAVPAPAGMATAASSPPASAGPSLNSLDFHQVLDALVRTSGFAPAGDSEAAYAQKANDGTPVFSFKKLISLPFYLSTEDKSLDGLAPAGGQGYSMHSMPIMRRHVRRMSTVGQQAGSSSDGSPYYLPAESVASFRQYKNYINALNNQLAAIATSGNQQQQQYYNQLAAVAASNTQPAAVPNANQQSGAQQASSMDAMAAESALANYYASVNGAPYKPSGIGNRDSSERLAATSSPMSSAVQPPSSMTARQQHQFELQQQRELQQLISAIGEAQGGRVPSVEQGQQFSWTSMSQPQVGDMSALMNQIQQANSMQQAQHHQQQSESNLQSYVLSPAKYGDAAAGAPVPLLSQHHKSGVAGVDQSQGGTAGQSQQQQQQQQQQQSAGQQQGDSMQSQPSNLVSQAAHQAQASVSPSQQVESGVHTQPLPASAETGQQQSAMVIAHQTSPNSASSINSNASQNQPNLSNSNQATGQLLHHHHHMEPSVSQANLSQQQQQHQAVSFKA